MSKAGKIILIVAGSMLGLGIILTAIALFFGAKKGFAMDVANMQYADADNMIEETVDLDEFDSLEMVVTSADVIFTKGDAYRVHYKVLETRKPEIKQNGKSLSIKQEDYSSFFMNFGYSESDFYEITVPESAKDCKIDLMATSGDFTIDGINVSGSIVRTSGDLLLHDCDGGDLEVKATSGEMNFTNVNLNSLKTKTSSGDMRLENVTVKSLSVEKTSGLLYGSNVKAEEIYTKATSGDTEMHDLTADRIDCKVTSGEMILDMAGNADDYDFDLKVTSGDIVINGNEKENDFLKETGSDKKIKVDATSGDIGISIR